MNQAKTHTTFLDAEVPDPTDFPDANAAPGLRSLDSALRCSICGEIFDGPVTLSCGHCFCSCCIRSALSTKQECPSCRKTSNEVHLRPNPSLEEAVMSWQIARPLILGLLKSRKEEPSLSYPNSDQFRTPKKRKRSADMAVESSGGGSHRAGPSRYFASRPPSPSKSKVPANDPSDDAEIMLIPSSDVDEDEMPNQLVPDANVVPCPICQKAVKLDRINLHIDNGCVVPPEQNSKKSQWKRLMNGQTKGKQKAENAAGGDDNFPLPKASYATLKDRQLRDYLTEYGLPTTGDRSTLERRHQRWTMIYNANLDKIERNRKTKQELKRDLKQWEEEIKGKGKKPPVEDAATYEKNNKSEFSKLIEAARNSRSRVTTTGKPPRAETTPKANLNRSPPADELVLDSEEERQ